MRGARPRVAMARHGASRPTGGVRGWPRAAASDARPGPREACGLVVDRGNDLEYIPLENKSSEKEHFVIDPKEWVRYSIISKIKFVVHSHYGSDCNPSEHDKNVCKTLGVPYLIVSYPEKGEFIYDPS